MYVLFTGVATRKATATATPEGCAGRSMHFRSPFAVDRAVRIKRKFRKPTFSIPQTFQRSFSFLIELIQPSNIVRKANIQNATMWKAVREIAFDSGPCCQRNIEPSCADVRSQTLLQLQVTYHECSCCQLVLVLCFQTQSHCLVAESFHEHERHHCVEQRETSMNP